MAAARENPGRVRAGCGLGLLPRGGWRLAALRGAGGQDGCGLPVMPSFLGM